MKRRNFLFWFGLGGLGSYLQPVLAATKDKLLVTQTASSKECVSIGTIGELKEKGHLLVEESPVGDVLVVMSEADSSQLVAVDPTCTHAGCFVEWNRKGENFVCPCHSSKFKLNGDVISGRANSPLKVYQVKLEEDEIFVSEG